MWIDKLIHIYSENGRGCQKVLPLPRLDVLTETLSVYQLLIAVTKDRTQEAQERADLVQVEVEQ